MKTILRFLDSLSTVLVVALVLALGRCVARRQIEHKRAGLSPAIVFNNAVGTKWL